MLSLQKLRNIFHLGIKELQGLARDPLLLGVVLYIFTVGIYVAATAMPDTLSHAVIAIVDEDDSPLSRRLGDAFLPPMFLKFPNISRFQIDPGMDRGDYTFVLVIPVDFQKDVIAGNCPALQLNVDATRMSQAFSGSGYVQQILQREVAAFVARERPVPASPVEFVMRNRFNPNLVQAWFGAVTELINNITMLAIILTGAALIRERERGTLEHLLVMPVTAFEIMVAKIWSMMLVVLLASSLSLLVVIRWLLQVPIEGSVGLFMAGVMLHLFAVTSLGIFLATVAQNMPQLGMLLLLVLLPMQILSGGVTPRESMPGVVQWVMQLAPTTHFVEFGQGILFRGAGLETVWKPFLMIFLVGAILFLIAWRRFSRTAT